MSSVFASHSRAGCEFGRVLAVAAVLAIGAAQAQPVRPWATVGVGVQMESGAESDGFTGVLGAVGVHRQRLAAQVRGQRLGQTGGDSATRWEVAALAGPSWLGGSGRLTTGLGVSLTGGDTGEIEVCFADEPCTGGAVGTTLGLAASIEGTVFFDEQGGLSLRGDAALGGGRRLAGLTLGLRLGR